MNYYPILRGRQSELLAIRELASSNRLNRVIPIIEPVKATSTLIKTLDVISSENAQVFIIRNPQVGTFVKEIKQDNNYTDRYHYIINGANNIKSMRYLTEKAIKKFHGKDPALILNKKSFDSLGNQLSELNRNCISVTPLEMYVFRLKGEKIRLDAHAFVPRNRNIDYRNDSDEVLVADFDDLKEYFIGFSDYSIIGSEYKEGGFMPHAIAIHITYPSENHTVRVKHIVSDPKLDNSHDIARMYESALINFYNWLNAEIDSSIRRLMMTDGIHALLDSLEAGTFPGLGTLKKLTIKHHLQLMDTLLEIWQ